MKIGVFGDSFATRHDNGHGLAWYEMIQNKLNCEVISYGVAGSSLHYSYKKFIENHTKHDKIIILTTAFSRINLPIKPEYLEKNPRLEHLNQLSYFINHVKNMEKSHYLDEMVKALKYYYTYIHTRRCHG